ncbi:MAG: NAD(P)-dependent oxidoreductase [Chloroherpetonaceae bacterium]|nr:NAD(P)-dependent oxidoreductase [Chthonomonadaceae bacterium]MDW8208276.1 NAD(P)-dependent oxidoreductase [Chloroherpetonaceae bacterium]
MKRVLVTGASGFIGRHSLHSLVERGYEVHAVTPGPVVPGPYRWHHVDLLAPGGAALLMQEIRPTHLLHFAWYAVPGQYWTSLENFRWVRASLELLQEFQVCGGQRVVMAGTCAEYDWRYGACVENVTPLSPTTPYGVCKNALRALGEAFGAQTGLSFAWGRIFFLYGPHELPSRLVASVICALLRGEPARTSHGRQIRDFLHVQDVADAFVHLLESEVTGAVNVASGRPVALREVVTRIADMIGRRDLLEVGAIPTPPSEPGLLVADTGRLNREVGWVPRYSLEEGLRQTIAWWRENLQEGDAG